jgi:D-methionine transport system ATP-binding protein
VGEPIIQIRHLSKTFGSGESAVRALEDIDLTVEAGEIFGIIGLSGAGKSTLVRCMNLLERPTSGSIVVDGRDITALSERELRKARQSISMIFQSFNLLMQRTAIDNICFPLELAGWKRADAVKRARELLRLVELEDRAGAYPAQLSGGQKQRVAIARALATDPKVLLCDEATSALDPATTNSILALLKDLNRKLGVTVVVITHQMSVIEEICSRVAIIADSHIVESGDVSEVFRHPKTAAARKLIIPGGEAARRFTGKGKVYRITFDGTTSDQPVVAGMVLACGEPVNIWFADTKDIDGKAYGHMLVQLPENEAVAGRMLSYLDSQQVTYTEEEV